VDVVAGDLNKLQKMGFGRENLSSPQCVQTWAKGTAYSNQDSEILSNSWRANSPNSNGINIILVVVA